MSETCKPPAPDGRGSLVVAFRILLLVLAAAAASAAVLIGRSHDRHGALHIKYVCPMHADVTSPVPGVCPICRMDLEPLDTSGQGAGVPAVTVKASTYETYDTARRRAYGPDMPAPAWIGDDGDVTAILYADELVAWAPEERASFSLASAPGASVEVRATAEAPEPWDRSTRLVHYRPDPATSLLQPRDLGWLRRVVRSPEPPVIPCSAVLEETDGPYVLVLSNDGQMLTKRPVEIGRVFGGVAEVPSGLRSAERVLIGSAFFVDAERRLRQATTIGVTSR
jgi:multidrug efflux pump subunit AcrA (membrane-fusion protein)